MCLFKFKTPSVSYVSKPVATPARDLVDHTSAAEPDSPLLGGMDEPTMTTKETTTKKKGKSALKVSRGGSKNYNPLAL